MTGKIPSEIGIMSDLGVLWLCKFNFQLVDCCIIIHLRTLQLSICALCMIKMYLVPSEIGLLTNLTKLDLSNNQLAFIPTSIVGMTNLELSYDGNLQCC